MLQKVWDAGVWNYARWGGGVYYDEIADKYWWQWDDLKNGLCIWHAEAPRVPAEWTEEAFQLAFFASRPVDATRGLLAPSYRTMNYCTLVSSFSGTYSYNSNNFTLRVGI